MGSKSALQKAIGLAMVVLFTTGCGGARAESTSTPVPPTATAIPTKTPIPLTATAIPTKTPIPPTATPMPTDTPVPPTSTPVPPVQTTACESNLTADCEAGYAQVNDITMYYEVHGEGEPFLLLHGGTGFIETFEFQIPVLAEHFRVIAPDMRAHGRTTDSDQPLSYALVAEDMVALLELLGVEKADVVGWSDGAIVGLDLAINHPERVEKLVFIGANFSVDGLVDGFAAWVKGTTAETWIEEFAAFYKAHAPDPSHWPVFIDKIKAMWLTQPNYTREELAGVQAPMLVMDGEIEEVVRREHTEEMAQILPNAELKLIPNTGHGGPAEKPAEVNEAILEFLDD